jgi:hypothetical protein
MGKVRPFPRKRSLIGGREKRVYLQATEDILAG